MWTLRNKASNLLKVPETVGGEAGNQPPVVLIGLVTPNKNSEYFVIYVWIAKFSLTPVTLFSFKDISQCKIIDPGRKIGKTYLCYECQS